MNRQIQPYVPHYKPPLAQLVMKQISINYTNGSNDIKKDRGDW